MASKASAASNEPIEVLFALHDKFNLTDFAGPLEVLASALHDKNDESMCNPSAVPNYTGYCRMNRY
jgi:transcriptional regulator GlxA family with amidase domain